VYVLTKEEGGRHTPFFSNYHPQFYFRTTDVTGTISLPEGTEMVMPGDNTEMSVQLGKPIAMEEGLRFAIREGGRTVGAGRVTKINKCHPPPAAQRLLSAGEARGETRPRRDSTPARLDPARLDCDAVGVATGGSGATRRVASEADGARPEAGRK